MRALADIITALDGDDNATETPLDSQDTMVPPLQQKLEIMKKMANIPSDANKLTAVVADEDEPFDG